MKPLGIVLIFVAGCGGAIAPSGVTSADTAPPVLSFNADWSETQSGPLVGGGQAILHYDLARLSECRGTYESGPAWAIQGSFAADGGFATQVAVAQGSLVGTQSSVDVPITVPYGRDLAVWFENSDALGCTAWDSDYGRNYHFAIQPPTDPTLHFQYGWTLRTDGTPRAGAPLVIDYDLKRLPFCRQSYNELPTWSVNVFYRFDGGTVAEAPLTATSGSYTRIAAPARLAVPAGAHTVEMWFENDDRTGCTAWDSDYGHNYSFALAD